MSSPVELETWFELPPDVHFRRTADAILVLAEGSALEIRGDLAATECVLTALRSGAQLTKVLDLMSAHRVYALLAQLAGRGWLLTERCSGVGDHQFRQVVRWLGSQTSRPLSAFRALQRARAALLGVGGLGGEVAQHLAAAGVGGLVLVDSDVVERTNLNRQFLFDHTSLGCPKVDVACARLQARNPGLQAVAIQLHVETSADLSCLDPHEIDLLINCADEPRDLDRAAASYCDRRGVSFVTAGVGVHRAYWGPFLTASAENGLSRIEYELAEAHGPLQEWDRSLICTSSHSPYNSIVAAHLASDAILYLSAAGEPQSLGRRLFLDFQRLTFTQSGTA